MGNYKWKQLLSAVGLFGLAGLCEIGGGWLVWKWRRESWHWMYFIVGSLLVVAYAIIPTFQTEPFGRTYAVYGGFFIVLSLLWGWLFDRQKPDKWDILGSVIALGGVCIVMFVPRDS